MHKEGTQPAVLRRSAWNEKCISLKRHDRHRVTYMLEAAPCTMNYQSQAHVTWCYKNRKTWEKKTVATKTGKMLYVLAWFRSCNCGARENVNNTHASSENIHSCVTEAYCPRAPKPAHPKLSRQGLFNGIYRLSLPMYATLKRTYPWV